MAEVNMTFLPPPLGFFDLTSCARLRSDSHRGSVGCRLWLLPPGGGCLASPAPPWLSVALVVAVVVIVGDVEVDELGSPLTLSPTQPTQP